MSRGSGQRAVFLDRDGVLNPVVWRDGRPASPRRPEEFGLDAGAGDALAMLRSAGYRLFVITNQPDVSRGELDPEVLDGFTAALRAALPVDEVRICPHDDADGCDCRKPRPGMIVDLARRWGVDTSASWVVGDGWRDMEAGRAAGCRTILIRRSYNGDADGDAIATDLAHAVRHILDGAGRTNSAYARRYLAEAAEILDRLDPDAMESLVDALLALRAGGGRLFFLGVGGGAAHASHAATDFRKIAGIEAYSPADNVSELTARINDDGWDSAYAEYLAASRLDERDGVFVFSVGGGDAERGISVNLVRALAFARERGARIFGVVGRDGGYTARVADHCVVVPVASAETVTPHTESFQALVWHLLVSHPGLNRNGMKWETVVAGGAQSGPSEEGSGRSA